jgi:aminoglycoside phosphotransferase family enzyme/predicted kinase
MASVATRCGNSGQGPRTTPDAPEGAALQAQLVAALRNAERIRKPGARVTMLETHISYVLLTGQFAYKIKKAVSLGFLDYRTLSARRFYCEEELRLNRRLAPEVYLDVVAIKGSVEAPALGGEGPILEYAVRMREFPQEALAPRALAGGQFSARHIDALATRIATFHHAANTAPAGSTLGAPHAVLRLALQNFCELRPLLRDPADLADLEALEAWTNEHYAACAQAMARRHQQGFIRECHGDLHLGNIAVVDDAPLVFDCIEFNDEMRWIDVMNEIAFTTMDLQDRGRADLAYRFLNAYLEVTGDYDGLGVLRFYLVYRAMVRAKVVRLRLDQLTPGDAANALGAEYDGYIRLAKAYAEPSRPAIIITHGLAGSGKTTLSQALLETVGAVRIRTDVERKRLDALPPADGNHAGIETGLYTPEATRRTYLRVAALAQSAGAAGYVTIVDATFLKRWQRNRFRELAAELGVPFVIIALVANAATLRERIVRRLHEANDASDADVAVLEHQLLTRDPLTSDERSYTVVYDADTLLDQPRSPRPWREVLDRLARARSTTLAASHWQTLQKLTL